MPLHGPLPSHPLYAPVSLLLYYDPPPLAWAIALLLAGKVPAHSVSHPHMDHTVGYSFSNSPASTQDPNLS